MTVPPAVVAANRTQLATLVATNVLGQNTAAIAATEAQYGEMWAQDAAAMYGYAGSSAVAATGDTVQFGTADHQPVRAKPAQAGAATQASGTSHQRGRAVDAVTGDVHDHQLAAAIRVTGVVDRVESVCAGIEYRHYGNLRAVEYARRTGLVRRSVPS